jgi:hypothetical protein
VISQTPEERNVTTPLLMVQTLPRPLVREMTAARPEVADAVGEYVLSFAVVEGTMDVNEIVCAPLAMLRVWLLLDFAR